MPLNYYSDIDINAERLKCFPLGLTFKVMSSAESLGNMILVPIFPVQNTFVARALCDFSVVVMVSAPSFTKNFVL